MNRKELRSKYTVVRRWGGAFAYCAACGREMSRSKSSGATFSADEWGYNPTRSVREAMEAHIREVHAGAAFNGSGAPHE